ncbi:Variant SH3 domain [Cedecea lapagei]|uniref:Variant SH3 domain n=1 Tax=Cedecea lapagei TaxID=158823 RepID=A0A3S4JZA4_9ENTR|nr:SH3 domain-containing protein [Cedecea lapagei]VEB97470.1 Variant SH3 domain [Cedecea lapagei]
MNRIAIVTKKYLSAFPDPIQIKQHETVAISHSDLEWRGWVWVTLSSGKSGWAPQQIFRQAGQHRAVCLEDYNAHELSVNVDEKLSVKRSLNDWYWAETSGGEWGWVPHENVALLRD